MSIEITFFFFLTFSSHLSHGFRLDSLSKRKWDEEDFEGEMEEDFDDELADEGLPTGHDAVAPGKGILLLPHRHLHPHSQLLKVRPSVEQEPHVAVLPTHATHSHLGGQDHGEWTYEEQFRQVGVLLLLFLLLLLLLLHLHPVLLLFLLFLVLLLPLLLHILDAHNDTCDLII